ncbi:MAG: chemotaxis response regulator protein-glutamate methylesterase [Proteobacteria bacterium]|nr:chemotaxis response regulator protein-glutamate methylesterase [Pseudomonadota bacterium]
MKKILIIDDSPFTRKILKEMIEEDPEFKVIDTAANGVEGLKKALTLKPDLITVDLEMPEMDGFSFLRFMMAQQPIPTIVVSSLHSSENVFKALEMGAVDFVMKPTQSASYQLLEIKKDLLFKIRAALISNIQIKKPEKTKKVSYPKNNFRIIAIGSSTGGPQAITRIVSSLQGNLNAPILIAQHMPEGFTKVFAERLNKSCALNVSEVKQDEIIEPGNVYIAPGGSHLRVKEKNGNLFTEIVEKKNKDIYIPSVNVLFESLVPYSNRCIAIILTGMGSDGKNGAIKLKEGGAKIWAESKESAVIFGMPQEVIKAGIADKILPLWDIPLHIIKEVGIID